MIQAVIDKASPGTTILVDPGNYTEQISITKNGISLEGNNAVIFPPSVPSTNHCTDLAGPGTQAGICVAGDVTYIDQPFDGEHKRIDAVVKAVKGVTVKGFTVVGFSGLNIAVLGAQDTDIKDNTVSAGPQYGMLTVGSKNTDIRRNVVLPGGFIAICMDDISTVEIADNDVSGYYIGICVQTNGADIHGNTVHDSCFGAFVDPNISSASIHDNTFKDTAVWCNATLGIAGVIISGAQKTGVRSNTITNSGLDGAGAGLVIVDDAATGAVTSGTEVHRNKFSGNNLDIFEQATGTKNVIKSNMCASSVPAGLCPS